ncbi:MAG TPA: AAA family ATPase [Gemmataceae bacterium]
MSFPPCPQPPDWKIDWPALDSLSWLRDMQGCPQNPVRHAEGDVWTHVHMVCEAMAALPAWRELPAPEREVLFAAALLHDVAKPACTRVDPATGQISSRGHAWKGAIRARQILWRRGVPFAPREQVAALVRHHLVPFYLIDHADPRRLAVEVSQTARCDHLAILAEADARGRVCPDPEHLLNQIDLFRQTCEELGCARGPYPFASDHARFLFFRDPARQPDSPAYEEFTSRVVLLSGLPGAGKDFWLRRNMPGATVVALDALRAELKVPPGDPEGQGRVLSLAREQSRELLRAGRPFVWNATNLSRHVRGECVRLFADYNAHVRIVYVEAPYERLLAQNRSRRRRVPERVIERLLDRWEVPDRCEAHQVEWVVG